MYKNTFGKLAPNPVEPLDGCHETLFENRRFTRTDFDGYPSQSDRSSSFGPSKLARPPAFF